MQKLLFLFHTALFKNIGQNYYSWIEGTTKHSELLWSWAGIKLAFTKCLCVKLHNILSSTIFSTSVTYFYTLPKLLHCFKNVLWTWSYIGTLAMHQRERSTSVASTFFRDSQTRCTPTSIFYAWNKIESIKDLVLFSTEVLFSQVVLTNTKPHPGLPMFIFCLFYSSKLKKKILFFLGPTEKVW